MDEKEQPQPQTPDQGSIEVPETRPQTHEQEVPSERPKDRETHRADEQAAIEQIRSKLAEEAPKHAPQKPQEEPLQQISRTTWDKVRDTLNVWPYTIELMQRLTRRKETGAIIDFLDAQQNDKILEIGCNTGYLLQQNHEQKGVGPNYTALDQNISSAARRRAEKTAG